MGEALTAGWQLGDTAHPWSWTGSGLPNMTLRVVFGGTYIQIHCLCEHCLMELSLGAVCHFCEGEELTEDPTVRWNTTFPIEQLTLESARSAASGFITALEDHASPACSVLEVEVLGAEIADRLALLLCALHPWVSTILSFRPHGQDHLTRFREDRQARQELWEEFSTLWRRGGIPRAGARRFVPLTDALLGEES